MSNEPRECAVHKVPLTPDNKCPECSKASERGQIIWITCHGATVNEVKFMQEFLAKNLPKNFPFKIIFAPAHFELMDRETLKKILENMLKFIRSEQDAQKFTA